MSLTKTIIIFALFLLGVCLGFMAGFVMCDEMKED